MFGQDLLMYLWQAPVCAKVFFYFLILIMFFIHKNKSDAGWTLNVFFCTSAVECKKRRLKGIQKAIEYFQKMANSVAIHRKSNFNIL